MANYPLTPAPDFRLPSMSGPMTTGAGLGMGLTQAGEWGNERRKAELIQKYTLERMEKGHQYDMQKQATAFEYDKAMQDDLFKKKSLLASAKASAKEAKAKAKAAKDAAKQDPRNIESFADEYETLREAWIDFDAKKVGEKGTPGAEKQYLKDRMDIMYACVSSGNVMSPECATADLVRRGASPGESFMESIKESGPTKPRGSAISAGEYGNFAIPEVVGKDEVSLLDLAAASDKAVAESGKDAGERFFTGTTAQAIDLAGPALEQAMGYVGKKAKGAAEGLSELGRDPLSAVGGILGRAAGDPLGVAASSTYGRVSPLTELFTDYEPRRAPVEETGVVARGGTAPRPTTMRLVPLTDMSTEGFRPDVSGGTAPQVSEEDMVLREARSLLDAGDAAGAYNILQRLIVKTTDPVARLEAIRMRTEATRMGRR